MLNYFYLFENFSLIRIIVYDLRIVTGEIYNSLMPILVAASNEQISVVEVQESDSSVDGLDDDADSVQRIL